MESRYTILSEVGRGSFGVVHKAISVAGGQLVAIKTITGGGGGSWRECLARNKEIGALMRLKHVNVITLLEVSKLGSALHLVFEYTEDSLLSLLKAAAFEPIPRTRVCSIAYQLLQGVSYMHSKGLAHRDLKPENVLLTRNKQVKIIDFGLSRDLDSARPATTYIATRWYRAPELLLGDTSTRFAPCDVWALGCLLAELYSGKPLFAGEEGRQMRAIELVRGAPQAGDWPHGLVLAARCGYAWLAQSAPKPWLEVLPQAPYEAFQMLDELLAWDPAERCTAHAALSFPLFEVSMQ